jgi:hypothetical protein
MSEHAIEPWILGGCSGRMITTEEPYYGEGFLADVDTLANARRIVACVNACAGIETCDLEKLKAGELFEQFFKSHEADIIFD